jgi:hypothetical protein
MGILENIKQRPDNQKKFFSLVLALVLTLFIIGFWFSFMNNSSDNKTASGGSDKLSSVSPWQVIKDEFSKAFSGFSTDLSSTTESSSTVPVEVVNDNGATSSDIIITTTSTSPIKN